MLLRVGEVRKGKVYGGNNITRTRMRLSRFLLLQLQGGPLTKFQEGLGREYVLLVALVPNQISPNHRPDPTEEEACTGKLHEADQQ